MLPVHKVLKSSSLLKPIFDDLPQGFLNIMYRSYTKEIYERAKAVENVHFLKIVRIENIFKNCQKPTPFYVRFSKGSSCKSCETKCSRR